MSDDDLNREVADEMTKLHPIITNSVVNQAVIRAMISTHPDPDRVRKVAESLLMQAQAKLALADPKQPRLLSSDMQAILESMFRPPKQIE